MSMRHVEEMEKMGEMVVNLFKDVNTIGNVLDATTLRYEVISQNISNVDTPGYKRKDVMFEELLANELNKTGQIDTHRITPKIYTDHENYSYRLDGNNVDIDTEIGESVKTKLRYDVLVERATSQLGRLKTILQTLK